MIESEFYQKKISPLLKSKGLFFERIESPRIPDVYVYGKGKMLWIELKCVNKRSKIVKPVWQPGQLPFLQKHEKQIEDSTCLGLYYCGSVYFLKPQKTYKEEELICQRKCLLDCLIQ
jgi:hypothetical protein